MSLYYLSGCITAGDKATPEEITHNIEVFNLEEARLINEGHAVFNPCKQGVGDRYEKYLVTDLLYILENKPMMLMLPNWETSLGSRIEHEMAKRLWVTIEYK